MIQKETFAMHFNHEVIISQAEIHQSGNLGYIQMELFFN